MLTTILKNIALLGRFWQEKANSIIFRWNLFFISLQVGLLVFKFTSLPPQIPLFYSLPWGEQQLASTVQVIYLPILSAVIMTVNSFWAAFLTNKNPLLSRLLTIFSLVFSFFIFYSLFQIVFLVT